MINKNKPIILFLKGMKSTKLLTERLTERGLISDQKVVKS